MLSISNKPNYGRSKQVNLIDRLSFHAESTPASKLSYRKGIMRAALVCSLLTSMLVHAEDIPENPKEYYGVDKASGLIMAPGWETVKGQCNACHTSLIVAQNSGNREQWRETIQWMVDTQGLWDLSDTWDPVLDYLSTYYQDKGIDMNKYRRKPIDSALMPPMPGESQ
ncbi:cytochrome C [Vibrio splendidus]|uniref:cytochrome C n=1 Tax=Vibrio splendidus TaxID=29497 RepID=UPI000C81C997|nr:cytochrome C [Vibrio splendidus]MDH5914009.1 cytochrome C [Vibrio splendidus]MDH5941618.1 cytochrome C [Vibrio splendidus]MDH5987340.1 cytochrome C [Vibrio splendidus]MDH5993582.1 cytochrome C [Vibrio splendidus]MDH6007268.1 cytochrome C [Vibrio splendidus]